MLPLRHLLVEFLVQPRSSLHSVLDFGSKPCSSYIAVVAHSLLATLQSTVDNLQHYDLQHYNKYIETIDSRSHSDNVPIIRNYSTLLVRDLIPYFLYDQNPHRNLHGIILEILLVVGYIVAS